MPRKKVEFHWRPGSPFRGDANEVGLALMELAKKHRTTVDQLTASIVVDAAMEGHPVLGSLFNFKDIAGAARLHWEQRARRLLTCCQAVYKSGGVSHPVNAWVNVKFEGERTYVPSSQAMADPDMSDQVEASCRAGIQAWRARYESLLGLSKVHKIAEEELQEAEEPVPA